MSLSESEVTELLFNALSEYEALLGRESLMNTLPAYANGYRPDAYLYQPDEVLTARISDYKAWTEGRREEEPGKLMEEIAVLAFRCLKGGDSIESYQSFASQIDLVISGSNTNWFSLLTRLHIDPKYSAIVIESKNINKKVNDQQFKRLCYIVEHEFGETSALGVFITRYGASGFPNRDGTRIRALRDAQATQVIFHAKTSKFVIVFDEQDLLQLANQGSLPRLLEAKIRSVEQWAGIPTEIDEKLQRIDLPPHLNKYM